MSRWSSVPEVSSVKVSPCRRRARHGELWHRFCAAAGISDGEVSLDEVRDNESLGYASCDYLRRANAHLQDVAPRRYRKGMRPLASRVLVPLRSEETRPQLDQRSAAYARARNAEIRELLTSGGHRLHGSLEDLPVPQDLTSRPAHRPASARAGAARGAGCLGRRRGRNRRRGGQPSPDGLEDLVADGTRLLRQANGWDG